MEEQPPILDYHSGKVQSNGVAECIVGMAGYLFVTFLAISFLEPGLTPPGFTGNGFAAMVFPLVGAFHLARYLQTRALFFTFGCLGAMLLIPSYFDNRRGFAIAAGRETIAGIVFRWSAFVLGMGLLTVLSARLRALRDE